MILESIGGLLVALAAVAAFFSGYCFGKSDGLARRTRPGWDKIIDLPYRLLPKKWKGK